MSFIDSFHLIKVWVLFMFPVPSKQAFAFIIHKCNIELNDLLSSYHAEAFDQKNLS